jgi:transketolase
VMARCEGTPELILIGTGSELSLAAKAYEQLTADGVKARLVSLPSWSRYEEQSDEYKESVLPGAVEARVAVEMGSELGWDRYVGSKGVAITMHSFGASAPAAKLADKFGFTVENVVKVAKGLIG